MQILNYCLECQRIFSINDQCEFCGSHKIKSLKKSTSVNVIGTKIKGKLLNHKDGMVSLIINTENNEKIIRNFEIKELKKIL